MRLFFDEIFGAAHSARSSADLAVGVSSNSAPDLFRYANSTATI